MCQKPQKNRKFAQFPSNSQLLKPMAKQDFIPKPDNNFLIWRDQFKTAAVADAATFGLVAADTTGVTNDNSAMHTKITTANNTAAVAKQATADKTANPHHRR